MQNSMLAVHIDSKIFTVTKNSTFHYEPLVQCNGKPVRGAMHNAMATKAYKGSGTFTTAKALSHGHRDVH